MSYSEEKDGQVIPTMSREDYGEVIPTDDDYVAWLCFVGATDDPHRHLKLCDSDTPGAFRVYRRKEMPPDWDKWRSYRAGVAEGLERATWAVVAEYYGHDTGEMSERISQALDALATETEEKKS